MQPGILVEVEKTFLEHGFHLGLSDIIPDEKIHRFKRQVSDKNESAWYVCFKNQTKNGKDFFAGAFGDWKDSETYHKFCTLSITDYNADVEKIFKKAHKKFEDEKKIVNEQTAKSCEEFWNKYASIHGDSDYLKRKLLHKFYGAKWEAAKKSVLVPMFDIEGRLWGYQRILENGKKFFQPGQKSKECFFSIENRPIKDGDKIFICEGFATGCSIYEATHSQFPVLCVFSAGNLEPVSRALRKKYRKIEIIICGDHDQWTEGNPGYAAAEKAAKAVCGSFVVPAFISDENKPTDFNDLHVREGLEKVREQILGVHSEKHYISALGYRGDSYFYTSSANRQISVIKGHTETDLLKLMPIEYWESVYPSKKSRVNWLQARSDLMAQCQARGIFDRQNIRGHGVWLDGDKIVIHLGDRLFYDGKDHHIHSLGSRYCYEFDSTLAPIHKHPLTVDELCDFRRVLSQFAYFHPQQMIFLGGWMALAGICGVLPWRPHLWITGEAGAGKTTVKDFVDQYLAWAFKRVSVLGSTTEAGLRQALRAASVPVVFDEFEPEGKKGVERVADTLDLMRQASSQQKGEIIKGTSDGVAQSYHVGFMALVSSIKTGLIAEADRSRFTVIELQKNRSRGTEGNESWSELQKSMSILTEDYARRLFARMVGLTPIILKNIKTCQKAFVELGTSQRVGQQYGTLVAGFMALERDSEVSLQEAMDFCQNINLDEESTVSKISDSEECLRYLLDSTFDRFTGQSFISVLNAHSREEKDRVERWGVRFTRDCSELFIQTPNMQLDQVFNGSKWHSAWHVVLKRLEGTKNRKRQRVQGQPSWGFSIPAHYVLSSESDEI